MKREILIIVDYRGLYRQEINRHKGINIQKVKSILENEQYVVKIYTYDQIINKIGINQIKDKIIIYTSSQENEYRSYMDDIIYELGKENCLIPSYDVMRCHENKCFEEILLREKGIESLKSYIFSTYADVKEYEKTFTYPVIVKCSTGSGSIAVYKADNELELQKVIKRIGRGKTFFEYYPKYIYKRFKKKDVEQYLDDEKYYRKFIVQQFVPNLKEDWKVLAFGEKYYVLNRKVRTNDFRASGSGKFSYIEPPQKILDYAEKVYKKLDVPFLSMDLCMDQNENVYLIEFQGVHFGPYTLMKSEEYYTKEENKWEKNIGKSDLSEEYGNAIVNYLQRYFEGE